MPKTLAFLRAINVGGRNVKMDVLRSIFGSLGFGNAETFIASGNVIFDRTDEDLAAQEARIEEGLEGALGFEVVTFLRSQDEVSAIAAHSPFDEAEMAQSQTFSVGLLKRPLSPAQEQTLQGLASEFDAFRTRGREVYWWSSKKQSESKFSNALFERSLGGRATFRTRRTFERLAAKYPAS